jgi:multidrug efflux system membrane fusion protein
MKLSDPPHFVGAMPNPRATHERTSEEIPPASEALRPKTVEPLATKPVKQSAPPAPKQRWWLTLLILAVLGGAGYYFYPQIKALVLAEKAAPPPPPARVIPVVTAPVRQENINLYLNGLGTVTGFKTVTVRSRVEGELMKIGFSEGQMVKEGDLLAEIDPRQFQVQLREAQAQLAKDKAALNLGFADYDRLRPLVASKTVTEQALQAQEALVRQLQATLDVDQGKIDDINLQLTYCRILSPINGRIGLRNVDVGNMIRPSDVNGLAVITQLQPIAVIFPIPQDEIAPVQQKMLAGEKLQVDAFDRDFHPLASGTLEAIDNQVDVNSGTVRLKAVFANEKNLLFPNQFVNARLLVDTLQQVVTVPSAAVQSGPNFSYVYVVQPDSTVDLRKIETGPTEGDVTAIKSGLSPQDTVVIDGIDKLQKGAKVAARGIDSPVGPAGDAPRLSSGNVQQGKAEQR